MIEKLPTFYKQRWKKISGQLAASNLDAWVQPISDEFQGEYPADYAQRLGWLCGFTGSAGMGLFAKSAVAALFVDGRYTIQARQEVPQEMEVHLSSECNLTDWLAEQQDMVKVGFDAWLHTSAEVKRWQKALPSVSFVAAPNVVDTVWEERPAMPKQALWQHADSYAGKQAAKKLSDIRQWLEENECEALFTALPDAVMWLLNLRGADIPYNPLGLCYAVVKENTIDVYLAERALPEELMAYFKSLKVHVKDIQALFSGDMNPFEGMRHCALDETQAPYALQALAEQADCELHTHADPVVRAKAVKNETELQGMRAAHARDGLAICKFLHWFYQQDAIDELQAIEALEVFRKESPEYKQPSFPTIAGAGANGAIVHYRASEKSNRALGKGELLLVDSGGQYADGTTDITRTMVLGTASAEQKEHYTRVLKGHIALSMAQFPQGITGSQLDPLARQYLWQVGKDYAHGTGHGVGAYLCVHEGPQNISKRASNVALEAGMILSNEPGYYEEGGYGIRIENLIEVCCVDETAGIYGSKPLTLAPYDARLINISLLSAEERSWVNQYHQQVYAAMQGQGASEELLAWLAEETKAI